MSNKEGIDGLDTCETCKCIQSVSWEPSKWRLLQEPRSGRENNNLDVQAYDGESDWIYVIGGGVLW